MRFPKWIKQNFDELLTKFLSKKQYKYNPFIYKTTKGNGKYTLTNLINNSKQKDSSELTFEKIKNRLITGKYIFKPYKATYVRKNPNEFRKFSVPTIEDNFVIFLMNEYLKELLEKKYGKNMMRLFIYPDFESKIQKLKKMLKNNEIKYAYKFDIKQFFDSVNKKDLLEKVHELTKDRLFNKMVKRFLLTPTVEMKNKKGSPWKVKNWEPDYKKHYEENKEYTGLKPGISISNTLANFYLLDIDLEMLKLTNNNYFRYVDDILIVGKKKKDVVANKKILKALVKTKQLKEKKSKIKTFNIQKETLEYLNIKFDNGKIILNPNVFKNAQIRINKILKASYKISDIYDSKLGTKFLFESINSFLTNPAGYLKYFTISPWEDNKYQFVNLITFIEKKIERFQNKYGKKGNYELINLKHFIQVGFYNREKLVEISKKYSQVKYFNDKIDKELKSNPNSTVNEKLKIIVKNLFNNDKEVLKRMKKLFKLYSSIHYELYNELRKVNDFSTKLNFLIIQEHLLHYYDNFLYKPISRKEQRMVLYNAKKSTFLNGLYIMEIM